MVAIDGFIPNNNFFPDTGKKNFIILHGTAGGSSAVGIAKYFQGTSKTNNPVSSHYIIDQQGVIIQTVLEKDGAWGNGVVTNPKWKGNPNNYTISIEHVKSNIDNSNQLTDIQKIKSFELIRDICIRNKISMQAADDTSGITGHFAIDPVNRARCPGSYPWEELWSYLAKGVIMNTVPTSNQLQAANDCWDSFLSQVPSGIAPKGTGIYNAWLQGLINAKEYGPPITHEYTSVDWNGNKITVQEFSHARCEWQNGQAAWYSYTGSI